MTHLYGISRSARQDDEVKYVLSASLPVNPGLGRDLSSSVVDAEEVVVLVESVGEARLGLYSTHHGADRRFLWKFSKTISCDSTLNNNGRI